MATITTPTRSLEWGPVIAGTILACAVSFVLMPFGHALGLSFTDLHSKATITPKSVFTVGLWTLWVQISASVMGGYLAGRLVTQGDLNQEGELRDGAHGLLVWALSTLLVAVAVAVAAFWASLAAAHGQEPESVLSVAMTKKLGIISGFSIAAISLVSAVIAWFSASIAGDHRDRKVNVTDRVSFRRRVARAKR